MNKALDSVLKKGKLAYEAATNYRFYDLKKKTNGMLGPAVYSKMYELCYKLDDLNIVEIGGATGAGSVALAWAMKDSNKKSKLIVVEKCQGGTRSDVGGYSENLDLINAHFSKFDVQDQITLFPHKLTFDNSDRVYFLIQTEEIGAFIHDADGRIDRDFYLFWSMLKPGGLIIIDDYADKPNYKPISDRYPQGGIKSVMTYRLLNRIIEWGLFEPSIKMGDTIFGYKPVNGNFDRFDLDACQEIISQIEQERDDFLKNQFSKN